jgi:CheY-like chemotaxis protein
MAAVLEAVGYQVIGVASGQDALESIQREPPDLILLDVVMPGMDGYEARSAFDQNDVSAIEASLPTALEKGSAVLAR